jgi:hypothetical protein
MFVLRAYSASGEVVGYTTIQNAIAVLPDSANTGILYYPVISYEDASGEDKEFTGPRGRSSPWLAVGEKVPVLVSSANTRDVRLNTVLGVWGAAIVLGSVAMIFMVLGFFAPFGFGGLVRPDQR